MPVRKVNWGWACSS
ncbi:hypothetical protein CIB84_007528 [Bambusicola thoracicus]|uniref:Uncharacterized protein n=1 Tax=Bambusicola thoracicus TaxID=9083 RepID=A0A2P4SX67_BAMTH|nr:hypothetical protein CIB84_007528 [Bambusicola thoracicus]